MSNFQEDLKFSTDSLQAWKDHFKRKLGDRLLRIEDYAEDQDVQSNGWDISLILKGAESIKRVEIKTRRIGFKVIFEHDFKILIEVMGNNDSKKIGSGIQNCNAEFLAYGFYNGDYGGHIQDALIFDSFKLKEWIAQQDPKSFDYKTSKTRIGFSSYETKNILIKLRRISQFLVYE